MNTQEIMSYSPHFLQLIGHELRWQLVTQLARSDLRVQELVEAVKQPQNLVSYHLQKLREAQVVHERRSLADGRAIYYSLDLPQMEAHFFEVGEALHPALTKDAPDPLGPSDDENPVRVLFLCTHNSARSQMAEGILRARGGAAVDALSAGTAPTEVHPLAIQAMDKMQIDIRSQRSKHLNEFLGHHFDYIITVCDRAREVCPVFPNDPHQIHWSFPDPTEVKGGKTARFEAFQKTATQLNTRISYVLMVLHRSTR